MKGLFSILKDCRGSVTVITVVMMFVVVGLLAFVIDLAHVKTVKTELSNAADACALRGARAFLPDELDPTGYSDEDPDPVNARTQAYNTISYNNSDNNAFQLGDVPYGDILVGIWDFTNRVPVDGWGTTLTWPPPSNLWGQFIGPGVTLPTSRTDSVSLGSVGTALASVFGITTVDVHSRATAALSGVGKLEEEYEGSFPIAVDEDKVVAAGGDKIFLSPDKEDVGGWTSLSMESASAREFKDLINHSTPNPEVKTGDSIKLQNGVACSAIKEAIDYYSVEPGLEKVERGVFQPISPIEVVFPVVEVDTFNRTAQVKGFMAANIVELRDSNAPKDILIPGSEPPKYTGKCMIIIERIDGSTAGLPGGGRWYGLLSTEPKLVE